MSTEVATSEFAVLHGQVWPRGDTAIDRDAVVDLLRTRGLWAAVSTESPAAGASLDFAMVVAHSRDHEPRAVGSTPGDAVVALGPAHDEMVALVRELGANVELGGVWWDESDLPEFVDDPEVIAFDDEPDMAMFDDQVHEERGADNAEDWDEDEDAPGALRGDVVLSHEAWSSLPSRAASVKVGLTSDHADGWTISAYDEAWLDMASEGWAPSELPVVHLKHSDETDRVIEVVTGLTQTQSHLLARHAPLAPVRDLVPLEAEHGPELVAALGNPHLGPESPLSEVLASKHFAGVRPEAVADALVSPMDAHWSARVLSALGLPTVAADIHEGRREATGGRTEVASFGRALGSSLTRYYDAPEHEVARRTWYGRSYAAFTRTPARTAGVVAADVAVTGALLWGFSATDSTWLKVLAGLGVVTFAGDALTHAALAPRRFRRRARD